MTKVSTDHHLCVIGEQFPFFHVQGLLPSSQLDSGDICGHFVLAIDPYGYNEKKRKRENLMRISGLSGKTYGTVYSTAHLM